MNNGVRVALIWCAVFAALSIPVIAGLGITIDGAPVVAAAAKDASRIPLLVIDIRDNAMREVMRVGPGGCLRGPLVVYGSDGDAIFELKPAMQYPEWCGGGHGR